MIVRASAQSGVVDDEAEEMLTAVFDFGELLVRQVMVPRTEMIAIRENSAHRRYPRGRRRNSLYQVSGLRRKPGPDPGHRQHQRLAPHLHRGSEAEQRTARDFMRDPIFIPETARVTYASAALPRPPTAYSHCPRRVWRDGGVVTLADLLEEIVGEVSDPFDNEPDIQPLAGRFLACRWSDPDRGGQ